MPRFDSCEVRLAGAEAVAKDIPMHLDERRKARDRITSKNKEGFAVEFSLLINDDGQLQFQFLPSPEDCWNNKDMPKSSAGIKTYMQTIAKRLDLVEPGYSEQRRCDRPQSARQFQSTPDMMFKQRNLVTAADQMNRRDRAMSLHPRVVRFPRHL